jgi:transposase-like protein
MKNLHGKSPCCREKIYQHGGRRSKCSWCGRTWRVRKKKQGRKHYRPDKNLLKKIFIEGQRLRYYGEKKHFSSSGTSSIRFRKVLDRFLSEPRKEKFLCREYILLFDALWFKFNHKRWTLYVVAARSVRSNIAIFLDPVLLEGKESATCLKQIIDNIPLALKNRVKACVSDGFRGSGKLAKENKWILQRCHFHLIAQLQIRRGQRKNLKDKYIREEIYQTARKLLAVKRTKILKEQLQKLISRFDCPRKLQSIIYEFLRDLDDFRSYAKYPHLNLPITNNTVESMNKLIRKQCAYLMTPESLILWATAFIRMRPNIKCNGNNFPPN